MIDQQENDQLRFADFPPSIEVGFARFVAAMVLHIIINNEIFNGLKMIKYSVNHPWKFSNPKMAFAAGFLQVIAMFIVSTINYLVIMTSESVIDVAKDFTALEVIAQFDDIFAEGVANEKAREVL